MKYFLAIAEEGSITKAAERLHMTQPPLSRELKAMEESLGVTLIDRSNRKQLFLTPQGKLFERHARDILHRIEGALTEVQESAQQLSRSLLIGTTIYCAEIMLERLKVFLEEYPFVVPEIHEGRISHMKQLLDERTVEVILSAPPADTRGYAVKELEPDSCVFLTSKSFDWDKPAISLEAIAREPLLLLNVPDKNSLYQRIISEFQRRQLELNIASVCYDSGLLSKMLLNELGSTIVPRSMVHAMNLNTFRMIPIEGDPWVSCPQLIWRADGYMSSTLKRFIEGFV